MVIKQEEQEHSVPLEDIGMLLLESQSITLTQSVLSTLMEHDAAVVVCDGSHLPSGIMLPVSGNSRHTAILSAQLEATVPFKKQLWRQTVRQKLLNQAAVLDIIGEESLPLKAWAKKVTSGDRSNLEGRGAKYYWEHFFKPEAGFQRDPEGGPPNNLLNYGYAILRAAVARALVSSGLHAALGIHHRNQYNAYCLADDIMEPYRPYIDTRVRELFLKDPSISELSPALKKELLTVLTMNIRIEDETRPLLLAVSTTTKSLADCYAKDRRTIKYPELSVQSVPGYVESGVL